MITTFKFRRGQSSAWEAKNPILAAGEPGYELDTRLFKIGDGTTRWMVLPYFVDAFTQFNLTQEMIDEAIADTGGGDADPRVGNLSDLVTIDKSSIVAAINEVDTTVVPLAVLYANAKAG